MLLKNVSASGLIALTLLAPGLASARGYNFNHLNGNMRRIIARAHEENRDEERQENEHGQEKVNKQGSLVGKAVAINGAAITLAANNGTTYTVDTTGARIIRKFGAAMLVSDIQINDQLLVQGMFAGATTGTTLQAKRVQDMSLQARNGTFVGTIQSISGNNFVLQSQGRGLQTILTSSTTKVLKGNSAATLSDLVVGATVRVDGVWDNTNSNVTASKVQIVVKQEDVHLNGTIVSVGGTTMTFTADGKTYGADISKINVATRTYFGNDATKIKAGDAVQVWGKTMEGSLQVKVSLVIDFSS